MGIQNEHDDYRINRAEKEAFVEIVSEAHCCCFYYDDRTTKNKIDDVLLVQKIQRSLYFLLNGISPSSFVEIKSSTNMNNDSGTLNEEEFGKSGATTATSEVTHDGNGDDNNKLRYNWNNNSPVHVSARKLI